MGNKNRGNKGAEVKSQKSHACLSGDLVEERAKKIRGVLEKFVELKKLNVLDIGTGSGIIAGYLGEKCKKLYSVDVNDERVIKKGYYFRRIRDEKLPFLGNKFDVVISNHVIEHVNDQQKHFDEVHRVLKKGGIFYLATPNKFAVIEPHYKLPLLSWLPNSASNCVVGALKKRKWDIKPLTYNKILRLAKERFEIINMTPKVAKNPADYSLNIYPLVQKATKLVPIKALELLNPLMPTYIIILRKK